MQITIFAIHIIAICLPLLLIAFWSSYGGSSKAQNRTHKDRYFIPQQPPEDFPTRQIRTQGFDYRIKIHPFQFELNLQSLLFPIKFLSPPSADFLQQSHIAVVVVVSWSYLPPNFKSIAHFPPRLLGGVTLKTQYRSIK